MIEENINSLIHMHYKSTRLIPIQTIIFSQIEDD